MTKFIPGFRSNKKWKKITSVAYYLFCTLMLGVGSGVALVMLSVPVLILTLVDVVRGRKEQTVEMIIVGIFICCVGIGLNISKIKTEAPVKVEAPAPVKVEAPAPVKYNEWKKTLFSPWDGSSYDLVELLKKRLNDPKSFEHVRTSSTDRGDCMDVDMTFRAKNVLGALVLQGVSARIDYVTKTVKIIKIY